MGVGRLGNAIITPGVAAERKRMAALLTHMSDSVLESLEGVAESQAIARYLLKRWVWELTVLATVVREGGDTADLERRMAGYTARATG